MTAKIVMIDELHCEMQDVVAKAEVKELFDYVVENNIPYYRAVTSAKSGKKRYYFDEGKGTPVTAVNIEWFENPHYTENVVEKDTVVENLVESDIEVDVDVAKLIQEKEDLAGQLEYLQQRYDDLLARYNAVDQKYLEEQQKYNSLYEEVKIVKNFFKGV